jgi:hypothetical protein
MKLSTLGAIAALILTTALAACGGKAQFTVQGIIGVQGIGNLNNPGLKLTNGGDTLSVPAGAASFAFPSQIPYGTDYNVVIAQQPAHQTCSFSNSPTGSAGFTVNISVIIQCAQNSYTLGGQFSGLTAAADGTARSVTLINGSAGGTLTISSPTDGTGKGDFVFGNNVADGTAYGVTVLTQPAGLTCTLANGTGVMHESLVSNLVLACAPN